MYALYFEIVIFNRGSNVLNFDPMCSKIRFPFGVNHQISMLKFHFFGIKLFSKIEFIWPFFWKRENIRREHISWLEFMFPRMFYLLYLWIIHLKLILLHFVRTSKFRGSVFLIFRWSAVLHLFVLNPICIGGMVSNLKKLKNPHRKSLNDQIMFFFMKKFHFMKFSSALNA